METGNGLSLSDQTVQYTQIIGTGSWATEDWREEPVISWEELQYQPALDYVADSQTLNFVKFVVEKSFPSPEDPEKKECSKDFNQWRWSITVKDGMACNCLLFTF